MTTIGLIDYGSGNFQSVFNALEFLGVNVVRIADKRSLSNCSHLILPGVGTFASAMKKLGELDLIVPLKEVVTAGKVPFLGICVGMQILADIGREFEEVKGLGLISGKVEKIDTGDAVLPIPHIGWNELERSEASPLFKGLPDNPCFYFVHSYAFYPEDKSSVVATVEYGNPITACIECDNVFGVQFHPEKSQKDGLALLKNFCSL